MEDLICFGIGSVISWALTSAIWTKRKPQCSSVAFNVKSGNVETMKVRCQGMADPRCHGGNCTLCCKWGGCAGKCLE